MLDSTTKGAVAPIALHDSPVLRRRPQQLRIAARMPLALSYGTNAAAIRIVEGCVAIHQELADGRRAILDIFGPDQILGEDLIDPLRYEAVALTFTTVETVEGSAAQAAVADGMRRMLGRAQAHAILLGRKTAAERVATALLDLSERFVRKARAAANGTMTTFTLYLTRADLADWLGLTLETVSRCLGNFKRAGLIAFEHPEIITICNRPALEALAGCRPQSSAA